MTTTGLSQAAAAAAPKLLTAFALMPLLVAFAEIAAHKGRTYEPESKAQAAAKANAAGSAQRSAPPSSGPTPPQQSSSASSPTESRSSRHLAQAAHQPAVRDAASSEASEERGSSLDGGADALVDAVEFSSSVSPDAARRLCAQAECFARGATAQAHRACLVPLNAPSCSSLSRLDGAALHPCTEPTHVRVVAKAPRAMLLDGEDTVPEPEDLICSLEAEGTLYTALEALQGVALPRYHGKASALGQTFYLYEDCGSSVSRHGLRYLAMILATNSALPSQLEDQAGLEALRVRTSDLPAMHVAYTRLLTHLHHEGYSHGDVFERNLCVRRSTSLAPQEALQESPAPSPNDADGYSDCGVSLEVTISPRAEPLVLLECRLVDLSRARPLSCLSRTEQEALIRQDVAELSEVFQRLGSKIQP